MGSALSRTTFQLIVCLAPLQQNRAAHFCAFVFISPSAAHRRALANTKSDPLVLLLPFIYFKAALKQWCQLLDPSIYAVGEQNK